MGEQHERSLADILEDHGISREMLSGPILSRRSFLATLGGGIAVLVAIPVLGQREEEGPRRGGRAEGRGRRGRRGFGRALPRDIGGWLHIDSDGKVTTYVGKVELGQNARTSLAMVVAEELALKPTQIHMVMGDTKLTPFDMGTFGSRTTPATVPPLRQAAAAARDLLLMLAAEKLGADKTKLTLADGKVTDPATHRSLGFGELTRGEDLVQSIPANTEVLPASKWAVEGKPVRQVDALDTVTGRRKYASDFKRPGMLYGKVVRPPGFGCSLKSADTSAAEAMPGVKIVRDGDFLAVAAPSEDVAERAADAVKATWNRTPQISEDELLAHLRKTASPGRRGEDTAAVDAALAGADVKLSSTYTVSYVAHAAIEPRSGLAEFDGADLTVWCATQSPFGVRSTISRMLNMPEDRVRVIGLDTGDGFGGKSPGQAAIEAVRIAKVLRKPVRVAWNREEEMTGTHFRPAGIIDIRSGTRRNGTIVAWECNNYNSGGSAIDTPYNVAHHVAAFHRCDGPLPGGAYRALSAPVNMWARESHMDEIAHALHADPVDLRLQNATDPRLRAVIKAAAQRFNWRAKAKNGNGYGIACGTEKGSYICTCVEVEVDRGRTVHVRRLVSAFECGAVINPLQLDTQIVGGATMALGAALFEAIHFRDGVILNPIFSTYRVPRFSDTPKIEAVILDRKDIASAGAGETPTCAVGGAIANAIFAATGVRLRALPLVPHGVPV